jgi:mRNA interferase MazF
VADYKSADMELTRGSIVFVRNERASGHVVRGVHPAVVIQNNIGNKYSPTVIVCFLTSKLKRLDLKTHVVLQHYDNLRTSIVKAEQMATIDKSEILSVVTKLRPEDMDRVDTAVRVSLGLEVPDDKQVSSYANHSQTISASVAAL